MANDHYQKDKMPTQTSCCREPEVYSCQKQGSQKFRRDMVGFQSDNGTRKFASIRLASKRSKLRASARFLIQELAKLTWRINLTIDQADQIYQSITDAMGFVQRPLLTPDVTLLTLEVIFTLLQHKFYDPSARSIFLTQVQQCQSREELTAILTQALE